MCYCVSVLNWPDVELVRTKLVFCQLGPPFVCSCQSSCVCETNTERLFCITFPETAADNESSSSQEAAEAQKGKMWAQLHGWTRFATKNWQPRSLHFAHLQNLYPACLVSGLWASFYKPGLSEAKLNLKCSEAGDASTARRAVYHLDFTLEVASVLELKLQQLKSFVTRWLGVNVTSCTDGKHIAGKNAFDKDAADFI